MTYQNGQAFYHDQKRVSIGDPFILRFNGLYYLYPSSDHEEIGIRCYTSSNLIDWTFQGYVCEDPLTKHGYAPEVIYADDTFYLATSPSGNGHYIFKADHPLGPFKRMTENIAQMIDGSFILGDGNQVYFSRADHKGIALLKMDKDGHMHSRVDLHAPLHGWTEGPYIIERDGFYYLTYCGNHLESAGYRTDYGTAKSLQGDYRRGINNPLLISTHRGFRAIGHSMTVQAPDLDGYYIVYHQLHKTQEKGHIRDFCIDRLNISGRLMTVTPTYYPVDAPKYPDVFTNTPKESDDFYAVNTKVLSKAATHAHYTAEFNVQRFEDSTIIFDYIEDKKYRQLYFKHQSMQFIDNDGHQENISLPFSMTPHRTIRIQAKPGKIAVSIDGLRLMTLSYLSTGGQIGYQTTDGELLYTAFSNVSFGSSDQQYPIQLPGTLLSYLNKEPHTLTLDSKDDFFFTTLNKKHQAMFTVYSLDPTDYYLSMVGHVKEHVRLTIQTSQHHQTIDINPKTSDYQDLTHHLMLLRIQGQDTLTITVEEGSCDVKAWKVECVEPLDEEVTIGFELTSGEHIPTRGIDNYILRKTEGALSSISCEFYTEEPSIHNLFSILFNVSHFSQYPHQTLHPYVGYAVGFKNDLCLADRVTYGSVRIYDKPVRVLPKTWHLLKVDYKDSRITVHLNGLKIFHCDHPWSESQGFHGLYASAFSNVRFRNLKIERRGEK